VDWSGFSVDLEWIGVDFCGLGWIWGGLEWILCRFGVDWSGFLWMGLFGR
jgi:hypothetical protein